MFPTLVLHVLSLFKREVPKCTRRLVDGTACGKSAKFEIMIDCRFCNAEKGVYNWGHLCKQHHTEIVIACDENRLNHVHDDAEYRARLTVFTL